MKVKDIMNNIIKISSSLTITEAAKIMDKRNIGSIVVEEDNQIVGLMTERDILRKVVAAGNDYNKVKVREVMSAPLITVDSEATLDNARDIMNKNNIRRLIVVDNQKIVGILTVTDIIRKSKYSLAHRLSKSFKTGYYRPSYG